VAGRVRDDLRDHQASLTAAGVAFYTFLSLVPALAASVSIYGLIADPDEVETHVGRAFAVFPADVEQFLVSELGAMVAGAAAATALAVLPDHVPGGGLREIVRIALWAGLALLGLVGLVLLYRYGAEGDEGDEPRWTWVAPGSVLALALLVVVTVGLNLYVTHVGSYDATYGTLAGVIVLLLWLHLAALIVLVGAHVNADLERAPLD
jgi:membrane protein